MKFISDSDFRGKLADILCELPNEREMVNQQRQTRGNFGSGR